MEEKGCTTSQLDCELCFPQLHRATLRSPAEKPTHVPFTTPGGDRHAVMTSTQNLRAQNSVGFRNLLAAWS